MLYRAILYDALKVYQSRGARAGFVRLARIARGLRLSSQIKRIMEIVPKSRRLYVIPEYKWDPFFFLSHRYYLLRNLTSRERVNLALYHFEYESLTFSPRYFTEVHQAGTLTLWEKSFGETHFSLQLMPANNYLNEGSLSVVMHVDDARVSVMSFSYVDAETLGGISGPILLITRRQSDAKRLYEEKCRKFFSQNSPPYFCLAAISGIARVNTMSEIAAVRHDAHPNYKPEHSESFQNSYTKFWQQFCGIPMSNSVIRIPIPLESTPISKVNAKHRRRARARRQYWEEIANSTFTVLNELRNDPLQGGPQMVMIVSKAEKI